MKVETAFLAQAAEVISDGRIFVHVDGFSVGVEQAIPAVEVVK